MNYFEEKKAEQEKIDAMANEVYQLLASKNLTHRYANIVLDRAKVFLDYYCVLSAKGE